MARQNVVRESKSQRNSEVAGSQPRQAPKDLVSHMKEYARENPEVAALWCFGLGFVLGWKLKIW